MVFGRSDVLYSRTCSRVCTRKPELHQNAAITRQPCVLSERLERSRGIVHGWRRTRVSSARCANGRQSRTRVQRR